jgi:hypothetical protein
VDGGQGSTGTAINYYCCLGLVLINVNQFQFSTSGSTLQVTGLPTWSPAAFGQPYMTGTAACADAGFNVSEVIGSVGPCYGTYTLDGKFISPNTWTGTLNVTFPPDPDGTLCGCSSSDVACTDQSFPITAVQ